ncbi:hypothetical protein [Nocardioides cavernaquae]|uniref:HEAT repeat domain-containing protein n=1 Tax=Nocardioides cavernaquae TaxID=2321396 RepID=A0A3A5H4D3_9ACTN|nr:hypothetical protein [Nocardioides cavernaquae]RJS45589.1 hypothetical protein D4739_04715 [Nocardioides cavernaquae]
MTKLKWVAAILASSDIAPHPNFRSTEAPSMEAALALHFLGRSHESQQYVDSEDFAGSKAVDPDGAALLVAAMKATQTATIDEGVRALSDLARRATDPAVTTVAALVAAQAAAELDRLETSIAVLRATLDQTDKDQHFLRALLLQNIAHQLWDFGETGEAESALAAAELGSFDPRTVAEFEMSKSVGRTSADTIADIAALALDAAEAQASTVKGGFEGWLDRLKTERPRIARDMEIRAGQAVIKLQQRTLASHLAGHGRGMTWRSEAGDEPVVHALYVFEFAGHPRARYFREVTAETRMTLALHHDGPPWLYQESLRLFRQAGSKKSLEALSRRMDESGPLQALRNETQRVAKACTTANQLNECVLYLLRVGAETLGKDEARQAFERIAAVRNARPIERGGNWQSAGARRESVWRTLFALSGATGLSNDAIRLFLADVDDATAADFDLYYSKAVPRASQLDGEATSTIQEWLHSTKAQARPETAAALNERVQPTAVEQLGEGADLEEIRLYLNANLENNTTPSVTSLRVLEQVLKRELAEVVESANRGRHSFGGPIPTALAIAALRYGANLSDAVADVLLDPRVARASKADALDRLAGMGSDLPAGLSARLAGRATDLLEGPSVFRETVIDPFPEGLRAVGSLNLAPSSDLQILVGQLLGHSDGEARYEGAQTLRRWAMSGRTDQWLETLVVHASHSSDRDVRGIAANALCHLLVRRDGLSPAAETRIAQLLHEDGSLIPRQVLNGLKELGDHMSRNLTARVAAIAEQHLHRQVRLVAAQVLEHS